MAQEEDRDRPIAGSGRPPITESETAPVTGVSESASRPVQPETSATAPDSVLPTSEAPAAPDAPQPAPPEETRPAVPLDEQTMVQMVLQKLLTLMEVRGKVEIEKQADGYYCNIRTRHSSGLLIGHRGGTLRALQYLTRTIVSKHYPDVPAVTVDVGGYRVRREHFLCMKATAVARIVLETKREMSLDILTEKEMQTVEETLKAIPGVRAYALGSGPRRTVVIAPTRE